MYFKDKNKYIYIYIYIYKENIKILSPSQKYIGFLSSNCIFLFSYSLVKGEREFKVFGTQTNRFIRLQNNKWRCVYTHTHTVIRTINFLQAYPCSHRLQF
jgi:hypothetical protein